MDEIGGDLEDYDENQEKTATALNQMKREVEEYNKLASSVDAIAISNLKLLHLKIAMLIISHDVLQQQEEKFNHLLTECFQGFEGEEEGREGEWPVLICFFV